MTRQNEWTNPDDLMSRVGLAMRERDLTPRAAAALIGVGVQTLERHLTGEHVRSDSALKYQHWLQGRSRPKNVFVLAARSAATPPEAAEPSPPAPPSPHRVVDIFSGCGGLSLGFDLLDDGRQFRTVLAVDNQAAPIAVLNRNAALVGHSGKPTGRRMDLTEFFNPTEFLAFYLEHVANVEDDDELAARLAAIRASAMTRFKAAVTRSDEAFLHEINAARAHPHWRRSVGALDKAVLGQTSVIGFHDQLRLPRTTVRPAALPSVLWGDDATAPRPHVQDPPAELVQAAEVEWDIASGELAGRKGSTGKGQLGSSARRVSAFNELLASPAMIPVRAAWARWRAQRRHLRATLFENQAFANDLRDLYLSSGQVAVLVGGPPCQGFSRIGRGKIRSLREAKVHVQGDVEAGDARNLLFRQYLLVVEALRPDVFVFENVQHFQSTVRAGGTEFQATEVLAEAIENLSGGELAYSVASRIVDASRHGVPQTRQRYFMCGVRSAGRTSAPEAERCLSLRRRAEVPLSEALMGLPAPDLLGGDGGEREETEGVVGVAGVPSSAADTFPAWIRQPPPGSCASPASTDAHLSRPARADDAALFALMGPGKRWMDYRADDSPTVQALGDILDALASLPRSAMEAARTAAARAGKVLPDVGVISELRDRVDGSLALRLLLEQVGEKLGTPHHLLTPNYLAKRDGHHGDWVARLDGSRPAKTMVSHMGKDTYGYVHPSQPRTLSVREAARVQTFPDWFSFGGVALTDAFKMVGNAVPPLLSSQIALRVATILAERVEQSRPLPHRRAARA